MNSKIKGIRGALVVSITGGLMGCASPLPWYQAPVGTPTAAVRFVSLAPGNTAMESVAAGDCGAEATGLFGDFHPGSGDWQAYRRGFDHRVGMPLGDSYEKHVFAEYNVRVDTPLRLRVINVSSAGFGPYDVATCDKVVSLALHGGGFYEMVVSNRGERCTVDAYQISKAAEETSFFRQPIQVTVQPLKCK